MLAEQTVPTAPTNHFSLAGWLSIVMAVLLVPEIALSAIAGLEVLVAPLRVINLIIGVFVLYTFRQMLNRRFDFHGVDTLISVLIGATVLFFLLGMLGLVLELLGIELRLVSFLTVGVFIPYCILQAFYGWKLLALRDDLFGLLRPYAYTQIASGVLGATLLGAFLALPVVAVSLVIQGMILLRARQEDEIL